MFIVLPLYIEITSYIYVHVERLWLLSETYWVYVMKIHKCPVANIRKMNTTMCLDIPYIFLLERLSTFSTYINVKPD